MLITKPEDLNLDKIKFECDENFALHYKIFKSSKKYNAFVLYGPAGTGKSTLVKNIMNLPPENVIGGHITPVELYKELYYHRDCDEPLLMDDCDTLLKNKNVFSILKNALDANASGTRQVSWKSPTHFLTGIKATFVFNSKLVFILNELPQNSPVMNAVMSRVLTVEYKLTYEELKKKALLIAKVDDKEESAKKILNILENKNLMFHNLRDFIKLLEADQQIPQDKLESFITRTLLQKSAHDIIKEALCLGVADKEIKRRIIEQNLCKERKYYNIKKEIMREMNYCNLQ